MIATGLALLERQGHLEVRVLTDLTIRNASAVRLSVLSAWEDRGRPYPLVVDLTGARRIDSSGVAALLEIAHRTESAGAQLVLSGLNPLVRRMLDRMGLGFVFQY